MKNTNKKIVIIAPDRLLNAFRILILSAPTLDLLAAEVCLSAVRKKIDKRPDIVLVYLEKDHHRKGAEVESIDHIEELKGAWPGVHIIAIISDFQHRKAVRTSGADKVLFEGITPARLLVMIEEIGTDNQ